VRVAAPAFAARVGTRLLALLVAAALLIPNPDLAAAQSTNPRDITTTDDEAGKRTTPLADEEGEDSFGRWAHRRWMRDRDSSDLHIGPVVIDNKVWVTKDAETADRLFRLQTDKHKDMPERDLTQDGAKGPFAFKVEVGQKPEDLAEQASALSACVDCDARTVIYTHRRIVLREKHIVTTMYIFGRENVATPELAVWFAWQVANRMKPPAPEPAEE
jgi:hypothetical protein